MSGTDLDGWRNGLLFVGFNDMRGIVNKSQAKNYRSAIRFLRSLTYALSRLQQVTRRTTGRDGGCTIETQRHIREKLQEDYSRTTPQNKLSNNKQYEKQKTKKTK